MRAGFVAFLIALFALLSPAAAQGVGERILSFDSDVTIHKDASITVVETIRVRSEGRDIRRGIIREFPTRYENENGDKINVGFELISATRDGGPERFQVDDVSNGVEIRLGDPDVMLTPGEHVYTLTYRTTFQLGFFEAGDELYWNVTGLGWVFPIDKATATIRLPEGARPTGLRLWTGGYGSTASNGVIEETAPGVVVARANVPLGPREGLTIAVQWPKGVVQEPGAADYFMRWLGGNMSALFGLGGLAAGMGYLLYAWRRWGKDPAPGTVIPLFEPPDGMEPADARFLTQMGYDNKIFAAAIVNMAVKGAVTIEEDPGWFSKTFTLRRTGEAEDALSPAESHAFAALFSESDEIELKQANWERIKEANDALSGNLRDRHVGAAYKENYGPVIMTLGILALGGVAVFFTARGNLATGIGAGALGLGAVVSMFFFNLMKKPTAEGQSLRDRIGGFRMFLDTAEKERWEVLNPPQMTPQLFEKYLPFALALGVDHTWSQTFEREMRVSEPGRAGEYHYSPRWYRGRDFAGVGAGGLVNTISNAMTGAISSSATPPGKSSGFSGRGGFSGGGGGGGGGRGW